MTYLALEQVAHEKVVVHGLGNNLSHGFRGHLNVGVVSRCASLIVYEQNAESPTIRTHLLVSGQTQSGDISELGEVLLHLLLVEPVGNSAEEQCTFLAVLNY
jgi:hypothetical protein